MGNQIWEWNEIISRNVTQFGNNLAVYLLALAVLCFNIKHEVEDIEFESVGMPTPHKVLHNHISTSLRTFFTFP